MSIIILLVISVVHFVLAIALSYRIINLLQLEGYKYVKSRKMDIIWSKSLIIFWLGEVFNLICYIAAIWLGNIYVQLLAQGILVICVLASFLDDRDLCKRQKLVITARVKRLAVVYMLFVIVFIALILLIEYMIKISKINIYTALIPLLYLILPLLAVGSVYANLPLERFIAKRYVAKCKKILAQKDIIKIAITGSYAKTSVKNILTNILSQKYKTFCTPMNYNTPMGICRAVGQMSDDCQIFVAEMGARNCGDIKELCDIVVPDYGIITGIAEQHLGTFGDIDNIIKTKKELADYIVENKKSMIFLGNNEHCSKIYKDIDYSQKAIFYKNRYEYYEDKNQNIFADNIEYNENGLLFDLHINSQLQRCQSKLIGLHNLDNILLAVSVAHRLGLNIVQIAKGIEQIQPVEHRLQLINLPNGVKIIDDSYNGNPQGAKLALETLSQFKGRKIVATQGLVELGDKQIQFNYELGEQIAKVGDIVILIGPNSQDIKTGLLASGYCDKNMYQVQTLNDAQNIFAKILKSGDVLLIQNDLTDNY